MQKIINKTLNFLKIILIIIFLIIFLDLLINILIPDSFKKRIGISRNYSLKSEAFHHEIAPNIDVYEHWGSIKYKVKTNNYSMRILNKNYSEINNNKKNIGFIGDSFVYGSGINYEDHFINLLNNEFSNYNLLNLGYVSYSPSIYSKRLGYYLKDRGIKFEKIFLFIDHSDIQDEGIFYREDNKGNIVRKWLNDDEIKRKAKRYKIKNYLQQNSFIYKLSQFFQPTTPDKSLICLKETDKIKNFIDYFDFNRFGYGIDKNLQKEEWVQKGILKVIKYLNVIKSLSEENNFELIIVNYPSAVEVLKKVNLNESLHHKILYNWSTANNVEFIYTSNSFSKLETGLSDYKENFIKCDIHWNKNGHKIIANFIKKKLNEKNN